MAKKPASPNIIKRSLHFLDVAEEKNQFLPPIQGYENKELVSLERAVEPIESLVPNIQKMVGCAKEGNNLSIEGLSMDEVGSIRLYTLEWEPREKSLFYILNQTLRAEDRNKLKPWFLFLKLIITALGRLSTMSGEVYRGVKLDLSSQYTEGTVFTWWGFSSCTSSANVLETDQFLGTRGQRTFFVIKCKTGKDIRKLSFYQNEFEILLAPATRFRVIKCRKTSDLTTVELEELQPTIAVFPSHPTSSNEGHTNEMLERLIQRCDTRSSVVLDQRHLTDLDMWIIVEQALNKKQCVELSLAKNRAVTSHGISVIALALQTNTTLIKFYITHNPKFGNESAEALARGLRTNRYLQVLDLSQNAIEDNGAEQLAEMLKVNKTLRDLDLANNQIHNSGIQALATALRQSNNILERLSIDWNPFADGCVKSLIDMLKDNRTLKCLEMLDTTTISTESKGRLKEIGKDRVK